MVCGAWEVWHEWGGLKVWSLADAGLNNADHRMVTGTLKTRRKKEVKKKANEKKAWRRKDKGDRGFWEDLKEVSEEMMGRWCNEIDAKKEIWNDEGREVCEEVWQDWLSVHNHVAEKGIGYQKARRRGREQGEDEQKDSGASEKEE